MAAGPAVDLTAFDGVEPTAEALREVTGVVMTSLREMVGSVRGEPVPEGVWNRTARVRVPRQAAARSRPSAPASPRSPSRPRKPRKPRKPSRETGVSRAAVLTAGSWGTVFAKVLADAGTDVCLVARDPESPLAVNEAHVNPRYLPASGYRTGSFATPPPRAALTARLAGGAGGAVARAARVPGALGAAGRTRRGLRQPDEGHRVR